MKKALLQVHISVLLAGFTGPLGRLIHLNEFVLVWYRLMFTSVTLVVILLFTGRMSLLSPKDFLRHALAGLLIGLHWILFFGSIQYSNVSIALVCFSSTSLFTALLEAPLLKSRFDPAEIWLSLLAIAGIFIVFHFNSGFRLGMALGLGSAVLAACFTILNKSLVAGLPAITVTTYELSFGFLWITLLLPVFLKWFPKSSMVPTLPDLGYLLFLSWACTVLAFTLMVNALKKVSSFTTNLSLTLEPVYGILLAFLLFGENKQFNLWFYPGIGLIFLSVLLQMKRLLRKGNGKGSTAGQEILTG
ncbi:MAG TPA: DMT family transporter [Chitinophagaceae bacterium]|nr:DMT family transporter [Chitinophagaceae bacterium]